MTERVYTGKLRIPEPRRRRASWFPWRTFLLLLVAFIAAALWWFTRDSQSLAEFVPAHQKYGVILENILDNRGRIANSEIWSCLPESFGLSEIPAHLNQDMGVPRWVLNNVVGDESYLTGNDVKEFSDVLFLTKMTRIGALVVRACALLPDIQRDYAGGLRLLRAPDANVYFASRGRVFLVSRSRDALIHALTVPEDGGIDEQELAKRFSESGAEDLRGTVTLTPEDPLGQTFQHLSFALRIEPSQMQVNCRGVMRPEWQERFGQLVADAVPQPLAPPIDGMAVLSLNFQKPVRELWNDIAVAAAHPEWNALWEKWEQPNPDGIPSLANLATAILGPMGPGVRLTWLGVDVNEMLPVPLLVATFDADVTTLETAFAALPTAPLDLPSWETFPRYDAEAHYIHVPMFGGPSIEPTFGRYGDFLFVSTSRTVADDIVQQGPPSGAASAQQGNLYLCVRPPECVDAIVQVGRLLAENNLLRGYTPQSFEERASQWKAGVERVGEITALAKVENGVVSFESKVVSNGNL